MTDGHRSLDVLTIGAIAMLSYVLANVLHEGVGHGGACVLAGCDPRSLSTAYFESDSGGLSEAVPRLVSAGGTLLNLAAGGLFLWLHRRARGATAALRYFLWLSGTVNLLVGTGYPLFSGVLGVGDWMSVVEGAEPAWVWRVLLSIAGVVLYSAAVWLSLRELVVLLGSDGAPRRARAVRLTVPAYLVGSLGSTIGSVLNPISPMFVFTSAAAHFGGTSGLAWMAQMLDTPWFPAAGDGAVRLERGWVWVVAAVVALAVHVAVLGPGVRL